MDEIRSKPFSETWDGTPNVETVVPAPAALSVTEATGPMSDAEFNTWLAGLAQRVAAITTPPVGEAAPVAPEVPEQPPEPPPVALHELSLDEFRAHAAGYWDQAMGGHRPPPPLTVSQYLTSNGE